LLDNQASDSVQGVPGLADIPVIGNLFRTRSNSRTKSSLMVFLHPKILRDAATEAAVSSEKYNYIRTEQLQMQNNPAALTPRNQQPLIPDSYDLLMQPISNDKAEPVKKAKGNQ
jgi:general secretion pathway protein D